MTANSSPELKTILPEQTELNIDSHLDTYFYNSYNLDPIWGEKQQANRVLLLEPSHFEKYPVSKMSLDFILDFAKQNIVDVQIYIGEWSDFNDRYQTKSVHFKEHPLSHHYQGTKHNRDWAFEAESIYPSFFSYWKAYKKELGL